MSTPIEPTGPQPPPAEPVRPRTGAFLRTLGWLFGAALVVAGAGGATWLVHQVRTGPALAVMSAEVGSLRQELEDRIASLEHQQQTVQASAAEARQRVDRVETAAREAALLVESDQGVARLVQRITELDQLKAELAQQEQRTAEKLQELVQTVEKRLGEQEQESAATLAVRLRARSLLERAQDHVLSARIHLAEENRGLAREELGLAVRTLADARAVAVAAEQDAIRGLEQLAESTRRALVITAPDARAQLELLWQRLANALVVP